MTDHEKNKFDLNEDGMIDEQESYLMGIRMKTIRRVAIASFVQVTLVTFVLIILAVFGLLNPGLITSFGSFLGWYYTGSFGIVAAWMGFDAFLTKK